MPSREQKRFLKKVAFNHKKLKKWARYAPSNHLHKFYLVEAEYNRVRSQDAKAIHYYEHAIALAKENEYINEEALAYEITAKFYLFKSQELIAKAYIQEARYCYLKWGAIAKIKHLAEWIENLVRSQIIENWESQDEPEHLKTIRDRLLKSERQIIQILEFYQQILLEKEIAASDTPEQIELMLSGLIVKQQGKLRVHNRIYELIFNCNWVERQISYSKSFAQAELT